MDGSARFLIVALVLLMAPLAGVFAARPAHYAHYSYARIQRGRYLTQLGDCIVCHTRLEGGAPFAGGRALETPFGTMYSTNITPDKQTGIGLWSEQDFYRAMHKGVGPAGKHFYPAFPYPSFTKVREQDVADIYAYLMSLKPVHYVKPKNKLPWPFSWRFLMNVWNWLFFTPGTYQENPHKSPAWNRGAYLAEGLGHCGGCHTPRNFLGAVKGGQRGVFRRHQRALVGAEPADGQGA
jgi:mono/diheme cytochrome c family protein